MLPDPMMNMLTKVTVSRIDYFSLAKTRHSKCKDNMEVQGSMFKLAQARFVVAEPFQVVVATTKLDPCLGLLG